MNSMVQLDHEFAELEHTARCLLLIHSKKSGQDQRDLVNAAVLFMLSLTDRFDSAAQCVEFAKEQREARERKETAE